MFSGIIDVEVLQPNKLKSQQIGDINFLLKQRHSKARVVNREYLQKHVEKSKVVVGWKNERIIGIGVLVRTYCITHEFANIHNLIIRNECDLLSVGVRIVQLLISNICDVDFVEAGVWLQDNSMIKVLTTLGFTQRTKFRYRLKL